MGGQRGQATVDYLAVVLVLAAVMGAAAALLAATGLGEQVMAAFRRALCVVTGGACDERTGLARGPCVLASERRSEGGSFSVMVLRVDERNVVLRERRADGTVALTLVDEHALGAELGTGVDVHARWGSTSFAVGRELRAALLAERSSARTWIARDDAQAAALFRDIRVARSLVGRRHGMPVPDPAVSYEERGGSFSLDLGASGRGAAVLSSRFAYGERIDHAGGRRTIYVRDAAQGAAQVSFGRGVSAAGAGEAEERFGVTFDRAGRPVDLMVLATLDVEGSVGLPPRLARIAGWLRIGVDGAKHVETEQHLDLTDPVNADVAQVFLAGLGAGRTGLRLAARALRDRLDEAGTLGVRTYASDATTRAAGGHAKLLGVGAGAEVRSDEESSRLVAAVARRPDGTWGEDPACAVA